MGFPTLFKSLFYAILLFPLITPCRIRAFSKCLHHSPLARNFLFGTASSAYQYEGAYLSDGKGLNNWDVFTHIPGKIRDGSNGDIAVDQYHRYLEDINLMESIKVNSYRFSISWARVLPKGRFGEVNWAGINYYNNLINALLLKGIEPFVTLSHFDIPQELEERYRSWLSPESQIDFALLAETCFKSFGDRVKYWVTFNEPDLQVSYGYRRGLSPPNRCSVPFGNCTEGDSEKEPFVAAHNMILSHATVVDIYRTKYQTEQGGKIGIVMSASWYKPISNSTADKLATKRALAFTVNWFLDPIIFRKYPTMMKKALGNILPRFSSRDKEKLRKDLDFIGINHYETFYVQDCIYSMCEPGPGITRTEGSYQQSSDKKGVPISQPGMKYIVTYLKDRYNNTPMFITENGYSVTVEPNSSEELYLDDYDRINYISGHLNSLLAAIRNGADVRGYFVWSLLDNFEWLQGFSTKYGLCYVDRITLKRTPRLSASWYKHFIQKHMAPHKTEKNSSNCIKTNTVTVKY